MWCTAPSCEAGSVNPVAWFDVVQHNQVGTPRKLWGRAVGSPPLSTAQSGPVRETALLRTQKPEKLFVSVEMPKGSFCRRLWQALVGRTCFIAHPSVFQVHSLLILLPPSIWKTCTVKGWGGKDPKPPLQDDAADLLRLCPGLFSNSLPVFSDVRVSSSKFKPVEENSRACLYLWISEWFSELFGIVPICDSSASMSLETGHREH